MNRTFSFLIMTFFYSDSRTTYLCPNVCYIPCQTEHCKAVRANRPSSPAQHKTPCHIRLGLLGLLFLARIGAKADNLACPPDSHQMPENTPSSHQPISTLSTHATVSSIDSLGVPKCLLTSLPNMANCSTDGHIYQALLHNVSNKQGHPVLPPMGWENVTSVPQDQAMCHQVYLLSSLKPHCFEYTGGFQTRSLVTDFQYHDGLYILAIEDNFSMQFWVVVSRRFYFTLKMYPKKCICTTLKREDTVVTQYRSANT